MSYQFDDQSKTELCVAKQVKVIGKLEMMSNTHRQHRTAAVIA
jgi:hypothetical protein